MTDETRTITVQGTDSVTYDVDKLIAFWSMRDEIFAVLEKCRQREFYQEGETPARDFMRDNADKLKDL